MRILDIRERSVRISRYLDPAIATGGLTTSIVAITFDQRRNGKPIVGFGFGSFGRYSQSGLINERFAPRLRSASPAEMTDGAGSFDPVKAWGVMMRGEKPGGHGERCIAVGALDMALWDAAAKAADVPLYEFLRTREGAGRVDPKVEVYHGGGYEYPHDDLVRLEREIRSARELGFLCAKIKAGTLGLEADLRRFECASTALGGAQLLAVDLMNAFDGAASIEVARAFDAFSPWWIEDVCDPLDMSTHKRLTHECQTPIACGEALFSLAEAKLLDQHGGLRPGRDILVFDPVHTYGLAGFAQIIQHFTGSGWPKRAFWPHGGHLFSLHVAAAFELGGSEVNAFSFPPFGGLHDNAHVHDGHVAPPQSPGIGFESKHALREAFRRLLEL